MVALCFRKVKTMRRKKVNAGAQTSLLSPITKTSIVPVTLRECKQLIYNIFAKPKYKELKVTKSAYIKLMCYINLIGDYEISGFGRIKDGTIIDFKILKQEVKPAYVECDDDAVMEFIRSVPKEQLSEWELDWHSHVDMGVTPSGTDWSNYEDMSNLRGHEQFPIMIINKRQEYTLMNYISEDNSEDIDLVITDENVTQKEIDKIYDECKKDIKENCTKAIEIKATSVNKITDKSTKRTYPVYDDYTAKSKDWWADYDKDYYSQYYCRSCGTQLLNSHELTTGLCEDCEEAVEAQKKEVQNGKF